MITEWLTVGLIVTGTAFSLLAAVGVLRMPDLYMRLQATTKSATLGVVCVVSAAAMYFDDTPTTTQAVLVAAFLFLTVPVGAHVIGRAAYAAAVPMWERTLVDEWRHSAGNKSAATARSPVDTGDRAATPVPHDRKP